MERKLTMYYHIPAEPNQSLESPQQSEIQETSMETPVYRYPEWPPEYTPNKVHRIINTWQTVIFSHVDCTTCRRAEKVVFGAGAFPKIVRIEDEEDGEYIMDYLGRITGYRSVPKVFANGICLGGLGSLYKLRRRGALKKMLAPKESNKE